jgi:hypothetical protein
MTMNFAHALIWFAILIASCFYFFWFGLSHLYDYIVGEDGVEFRIFRSFRIFTIRFEWIDDAFEQRIFSLVDNRASSLLRGLMVGNRLAIRYVVLRMKFGPIRYVGLTPADRYAFLEQVRHRLATRPGA